MYIYEYMNGLHTLSGVLHNNIYCNMYKYEYMNCVLHNNIYCIMYIYEYMNGLHTLSGDKLNPSSSY